MVPCASSAGGAGWAGGGESESVGSSSYSSSSSSGGAMATTAGVGGVGAAAALERGGIRHWIMTTSSWPGVPSQRMSPLRSVVWPTTLSSLT